MSGEQNKATVPITRGTPLARALDEYAVPGLSANFADRVLAAAEARSAPSLPPLPELRRPAIRRGWRVGQRIAIGIVSFGALATAAAATGLLEQFDIPVPTASGVWASLTGKPAPAPAALAAAPVTAKPAPGATAPAALTPVEIVGPIDTPAELSEAFRRIDEVRDGRFSARQQRIDTRIDEEIARRRAAGLRVPTPEQEAALRERIDTAEARRKARQDERISQRREELQRKLDSGETLTRKDVVRPLRQDGAAADRQQQLRSLRRLSPEQRREALRRLPPAERRALVEEFRARRAGTPAPAASPQPSPAPEEAPPPPAE